MAVDDVGDDVVVPGAATPDLDVVVVVAAPYASPDRLQPDAVAADEGGAERVGVVDCLYRQCASLMKSRRLGFVPSTSLLLYRCRSPLRPVPEDIDDDDDPGWG